MRCRFALVVGLLLTGIVRAQPATDRFAEPLPDGAIGRLGFLVDLQNNAGAARERAAVSADGKLLATVNGRGILLWDPETGKVVRRWTVELNALVAIAFGPDGNLAVLGDGKVAVFDPGNGTELRSFKVPSNWAGAAFSNDGRLLASTSAHPPGPNHLHVWDVATGKRLFETEEMYPGVFFSCDNRHLISCTHERADKQQHTFVNVRDTQTGKLVRRTTIVGKITSVTDLAPDGKTLLGFTFLPHPEQAKWASLLELIDLESGKQIRALHTLHSGDLKRARFAPDGKLIAAVSKNRGIGLWDAATGKHLRTYGCEDEFFNFLSFAPDGKRLVNCSSNGRVFVYEIATGAERCLNPGHWAGVGHLAFSPDGKLFASSGSDGKVLVWDTAAARIVGRFRLPHRPNDPNVETPQDLAFAPDGKRLLIKRPDGSVMLADPFAGRELPAFRSAGTVYAFAQDGRTLLWSGKPMNLRPFHPSGLDQDITRQDPEVWWRALCWVGTSLAYPELRQFHPLPYISPDRTEPPLPDGPLQTDPFGVSRIPLHRPLSLSPDGSVLVETVSRMAGSPATNMGTYWGTDSYRLSSSTTGREIATIKADRYFQPQAFAADGRSLVVGTREALGYGPFALLETHGGKERLRLSKDGDWAMAFAPDGSRLAMAAKDNGVEIVDLASGKVIARRKADSIVRKLIFSPDGKTLATALDSGTVLLWDATRFAEVKAEPLAEQDGERLWDDLAAADAAVAFRAMMKLRASPRPAVKVLKEKLALPNLRREAPKLIEELGNDDFDVRQRATETLESFGERAAPYLKKGLAEQKSLEHRRRLEALLKKLDTPFSTPTSLRHLRSVEVLEGIGGDAAKAVLQTLADGPATDTLANEARASLKRLDQRAP